MTAARTPTKRQSSNPEFSRCAGSALLMRTCGVWLVAMGATAFTNGSVVAPLTHESATSNERSAQNHEARAGTRAHAEKFDEISTGRARAQRAAKRSRTRAHCRCTRAHARVRTGTMLEQHTLRACLRHVGQGPTHTERHAHRSTPSTALERCAELRGLGVVVRRARETLRQ